MAKIKRAWKGVSHPAVVAVGGMYRTVPASRGMASVVTDMPSGTVAPGFL